MAKATIMLVEDDDIIARVAEWRLKNLGYPVCGRAVSGEEAVGMAVSLKPDLILMDITLKGAMDGIETTIVIKNRMDVPVIYLTSHSEEAMLERARATGPSGYILKPFDDNDLRVAIELAQKN